MPRAPGGGDHARRQLDHGMEPLDATAEQELARQVHALLFRLGRLEPLLADPDIENIDANGCDNVWLQYADGTIKHGPPIADSDQALVELIALIAGRMGHTARRFDRGQPRLHLRLPDGSRLFALMDVSHRPVLSIRRHRLVRVFLDDLVHLGTIDPGLQAFLSAAVAARKNILIAGGTGAGKTTLLRALINQIQPEERLVTVENAYELGLHEAELSDLHPNVVALEARDPIRLGHAERGRAAERRTGWVLARTRQVAAGLAGIVSILALLAGVPALLWLLIGWPLPHALPTLAQLQDVLRAPIPDDAIPKALAVLAWGYWLHLAWCLLAETVAAVRGGMARRVPGPLNQALASRLVALALLVLPSGGLIRPAAAAVLPRPPAVTVAMHHPKAAAAATAATATPTANQPHAQLQERAVNRSETDRQPSYVVQRHDTLWDIAERFLQDPHRWREIFALNQGRRQPDGQHLDDPNWINPGWQLLLPSDAHGLPAPNLPGNPGRTAPPTAPGPAHHLQEPSATTATPALPPGSGTQAAALAVAAAKQARQEPQQRSTRPATTPPAATSAPASPRAGTTAPTPPATQPASVQGGTAPPTPTPTSATTDPAPAAPGSNGATSWPRATSNLRSPLILAASGLLAIGMLTTVTRLRRVQHQHRRFGRRIPLPIGDTARLEQTLSAIANTEPSSADWLSLTIRAMGASLRHNSLPVPNMLGVLLDPGPDTTQITVLLDAPAPEAEVPAPLYPVEDGRWWQLDIDPDDHDGIADLAELARQAVVPTPALVTLGQATTGDDSHTRLLLNLETAGLITLTGDPTHTRALLSAMAVELATSTWAGYFDLLLVSADTDTDTEDDTANTFGDALDLLEGVRRVNRAELDEALLDLERTVGVHAEVLRESGAATALAARVHSRTPDTWTATVILCAEVPPAATLTRLARLANNLQTTVAAVIPTPTPASTSAPATSGLDGEADLVLELAATRLVVTADRVEVSGLDLGVDLGGPIRPQRLTDDQTAAIAELLRTAADTNDVPPTAPPYNQLEPLPPPPDPVPATPATAAPSAPTTPTATARVAEVRVLGPVEVDGVPRVKRHKSAEAIVYLVLHPNGVDPDRLWEALWPNRPYISNTLYTTMAIARGYLGDTPHGDPCLPKRNVGDRYRLDPHVTSDWAHFQAFTQPLRLQGHHNGNHSDEDDTATIDALRQALELVRGAPFEATRSGGYEWTAVHRAEMETSILDAADLLARLCLDRGDPAHATWAARRGLLANPYDERLYRALMRAAHQAGSLAAIDTVRNELLRVLDADDPLTDIEPETAALYQQLRKPRRRGSA